MQKHRTADREPATRLMACPAPKVRRHWVNLDIQRGPEVSKRCGLRLCAEAMAYGVAEDPPPGPCGGCCHFCLGSVLQGRHTQDLTQVAAAL